MNQPNENTWDAQVKALRMERDAEKARAEVAEQEATRVRSIMESSDKAAIEGAKAHQAGVPRSANPYNDGADFLHAWWDDGWDLSDAQAAARRADAAEQHWQETCDILVAERKAHSEAMDAIRGVLPFVPIYFTDERAMTLLSGPEVLVRGIKDALQQERERTRAAERRALEAETGAAASRGALEPLWAYLQAHHGDWYLNAEKREHAARIESALASNSGRKVLAVLDAARAVRRQWEGTLCIVDPPCEDCNACRFDAALAALDAEVPHAE